MKRKGTPLKHAPHLVYRSAKDGDVDEDGNALPKGYCAIVRRKAVEKIQREQGISRGEALELAPVIPNGGHSRVNMLYGLWRINHGRRVFRVCTASGEYKRQWMSPYWTCAVYWVEGGEVYQGTCGYSYEDPAVLKAERQAWAKKRAEARKEQELAA